MYASGAVICRALTKLRTARRLCWLTAVPIVPIDAPMMAAGMWSKAFSPHGREAQSIAFFKAPGIERLNSGVTKRMASEADGVLQRDRLRRIVVVVVLAVQREVPDGYLCELEVSGASRMSALDRIRLIDVDERLPTK